MSDHLYTLPEAAQIIGIGASALGKRIRRGLIPVAALTNTGYLLSADVVEAERKRVVDIEAGLIPRQQHRKPKPKPVVIPKTAEPPKPRKPRKPKDSPVVQEFWSGNWATIDRKPRKTEPRYESIAEAVEAARSGKVTAVVLDRDGVPVGEMKWRK